MSLIFAAASNFGGRLVCLSRSRCLPKAAAALWIPILLLTEVAAQRAGQEEEILREAKLLYSQGQFPQVCEKLKPFVSRNSSHAEIQTAQFMLGESYRQSGQMAEAVEVFEGLVTRFKTGPQVAESAYRLGYLHFTSQRLKPAIDHLRLAIKETADPKTRYLATFFLAGALRQDGQTAAALALYEEMGRNNPGPDTTNYLEMSRLEMGKLHAKNGNREAAAKLFDHLIQTSYYPPVKTEALLLQAISAIQSGKTDAGETLLREAGAGKGTPLETLAQVAEIFLAYHRKDFARVSAVYQSGTVLTKAGEYRPQVLYMVAESLRALGDATGAARLHTLVEARYPTDEKGIEAGFRKIMILYQNGDETFPAKVHEFADSLKLSQPKSPFIDKAYLALAEWHFFQAEEALSGEQKTLAGKKYASAAKLYSWIREENLDAKHLPSFYFHKGWSLLETGDLIGGSRFISQVFTMFPEHELAPQALARRGEALLRLEDLGGARADFLAIVEHYPNSPSAELALERLGRIFTIRRDYSSAISAYRRLLDKFPDTKASAEAHFWIGTAFFEIEKYREAIPYLEKAAQIDPDYYANKAGIRTILALHSLNDTDRLAAACRLYIQRNQDAGVPNDRQKRDKPAPIPIEILISSGRKLAARHRYDDANYLLSMACDAEHPERTRAEVWKEIGNVKLALEDHPSAIKAWDFFLLKTSDLNERGLAYLSRGLSQLALKQFSAARQSAQECLRSVRQGRLNADARILIGDICEASGDFETAIREFELVMQLFNDPDVTPRVRQRLTQVRRKLGLPDSAAPGAGFPAAMR